MTSRKRGYMTKLPVSNTHGWLHRARSRYMVLRPDSLKWASSAQSETWLGELPLTPYTTSVNDNDKVFISNGREQLVMCEIMLGDAAIWCTAINAAIYPSAAHAG